MNLIQTNQGIEVFGSTYRLLLERNGGYAIREVDIVGEGRLDRFDRPGEGPHPTCMYFDNLTINNAFQLAHYGKENPGIESSIQGSQVELRGELIPIVENASGQVNVIKTMRFGEDSYDVDVQLSFNRIDAVNYLSVWWDVNDKWLRAMRSSAGIMMPLQVGIGDAFNENLSGTWRPLQEMDRGVGIWMEMIGERVSVLASLQSPAEVFPAGGMKYWDGPDDKDEGEGVSHGCINLDVVNAELSGTSPLALKELCFSYRVFLSGPTVLRQGTGKIL